MTARHTFMSVQVASKSLRELHKAVYTTDLDIQGQHEHTKPLVRYYCYEDRREARKQ